KVTNLTDHDDVGVLTEEGAQRGGEVQADRFVHLTLVDSLQIELDRVFCGGNVGAHLVEFAERGIQRGRFTGTGGPGYQAHAVGQVNGFLEDFERAGIKAKLGHVELQVALVEQTHNDFFAEQRGQNADAEVHLAVA